MTDQTKIEGIIKEHVIYAMTAGAIPIPIADFVAVSAIQLDMIKQIAELHGADYDSNKGKSLASSLMGTAVSRIGASMIKAIPWVGTLAGIGSQIILSGAATYAMGTILDSHLAGKGTLEDFSMEGMKSRYKELLKSGKEYAKNLKKKSSIDDVKNTIEKLRELKESGAITEEEFASAKERLLNNIA